MSITTRKIIEDYDEPSTDIKVLTGGKNYLLVVAIDEYQHVPRLYNAVKDAQDIVTTLTQSYQFANEQVTVIQNKFATQENIIGQLRNYITLLKDQDNLLIFYSGHGIYDKTFDEGYWVPVDAHFTQGQVEVGDCISNSMIQKSLRQLKARHVVLVADACFAGSLVAERAVGVKRVEDFPSRWVLTAGRNEPVLDGKPGMNSPFMESTLLFLRQNTKSMVSVAELGDYVTQTVANNATQIPICTPLRDVGDKNGIFFFRRKRDEEKDWADALKLNTLEGYQAYLKNYVQGKYTLEASMAIERFKNPLKAKQGSILYNIPNQMLVGNETKCVVRVAFTEILVRQDAEVTKDTIIKSIRVSNVMSAELIDIEGKAFTIRCINSMEQFVDADIATEWIFYVKGLLSGVHRLLLKISVTEEINGKERVREIVLEEVVTVEEKTAAPNRKTTKPETFKKSDYSLSLRGRQAPIEILDIDHNTTILPPPQPLPKQKSVNNVDPTATRMDNVQGVERTNTNANWEKMMVGGSIAIIFAAVAAVPIFMQSDEQVITVPPTAGTVTTIDKTDTPSIRKDTIRVTDVPKSAEKKLAYNTPQKPKPKPIPIPEKTPSVADDDKNPLAKGGGGNSRVIRKGGEVETAESLDFERVKDDITALTIFIRNNPKAKIRVDAEKRLKELIKNDPEENYWQQIKATKEKATYENFLKKFPSGRHAEDAKRLIDSLSEQ